MKAPIIAVSVIAAVAFTAVDAAAKVSRPSEYRGYQACLAAVDNQYDGIVTQREYLLRDDAADRRTYYINATAWENDERVPIGIACDTSKSGRTVLSHAVTTNHYAAASYTGVQVAGSND